MGKCQEIIVETKIRSTVILTIFTDRYEIGSVSFKTEMLRNFFSQMVADHWNSLPWMGARSLEIVEGVIDKYLKD